MDSRDMKRRLKLNLAKYLDDYRHSDLASELRRATLRDGGVNYDRPSVAHAERYGRVLSELIAELRR